MSKNFVIDINDEASSEMEQSNNEDNADFERNTFDNTTDGEYDIYWKLFNVCVIFVIFWPYNAVYVMHPFILLVLIYAFTT